MDQEQKADIKQQLSEAVNAEVKVNYNIDPRILGGIIIRHGGKYVDNSLKRILNDAKANIRNKIKT